MTINQLNDRLKKAGYELREGNGYFYFSPIQDDRPDLFQSTIHISNFNDYTEDEYIDDLINKLETTLDFTHPDLLKKILEKLGEK